MDVPIAATELDAIGSRCDILPRPGIAKCLLMEYHCSTQKLVLQIVDHYRCYHTTGSQPSIMLLLWSCG